VKILEDDIVTESNYEDGSALIVVLGLITLISLLTVSIVTFSQVSDRISKLTCDRSKAAYWAEGATDRAIWLLRNDIVKHPTRRLGKEKDDEDNIERFLADGIIHSYKNYEGSSIKVSIFDAIHGIDISGSRPTRYLQKHQSSFADDKDKLEAYKLFLNSVVDYVDPNDFTHLNGGFEKEDYEDIGMAPLPRNYAMEYSYEMFWIPGFQEFFPVDKYGRIPGFRIIAPHGLRQLRGTGNIFAADANQLKLQAGLSDEEIAQVTIAKKAWDSNQVPLSDSLAPDLLGKLKRKFSFRESGYYTFIVEASPGQGFASRIFTCTLQITNYLSPSNEIRYYEWRFLR